MYQWLLRLVLSWVVFEVVALTVAGCGRHDPKVADSKYNRQAFRNYFGAELAGKVSGIYYCPDTFPLKESTYCFAFQGSPEVVAKIVEKYRMRLESPCSGPGLMQDRYSWWSALERENSQYYHASDEKLRCDYMLWHDESTRKCQFLIFYR